MENIEVKENVLLADYTTFKIGGPARYFFIAKNKQDLIKAIEFAKNKHLTFFILGGGSNLLVSDNGFKGVVIKIQSQDYRIDGTRIITDAGIELNTLVNLSIDNDLTGLEWAIGIPGTIGGAVKVNASAFGQNIKELVKNIKKINKIIISVELDLKKGNKNISQELIKEYTQKRKNTQPLEYPSAGCIFKNTSGQGAGRLIDQAGLKGTKVGQAMISEKHANFIINLGGAKSDDVINLIKLVKQTIKDKFDLELEEEIQYLGNNNLDTKDEQWEEVVDFTKIKKGGVDIDDILSRL